MSTMHRSCALLLLVLAVAFAQSGYHQIKKISIPGDGFWDYLTTDPGTGRVFVSHGSEVDVVDTKKGEVTGKITGLKLVHGIALAPEFNHGFISDGAANQVVVFDMTTLAKVGEVAAGMNPDGIIYDPGSKRVFAFNGRSANATAVDAEKGTLAGTVTLEGKPEFPAPDG
jgi:DNA-binding beta-propeller fold protein YncE